MTTGISKERDLLAEATFGRLHWNDPGMDKFEKGYEGFTKGMRVEIRTLTADGKNKWLPGVVVETIQDNERAIVVVCDQPWHDNIDFYEGRGALITAMHNTRRGIFSNIRVLWRQT